MVQKEHVNKLEVALIQLMLVMYKEINYFR